MNYTDKEKQEFDRLYRTVVDGVEHLAKTMKSDKNSVFARREWMIFWAETVGKYESQVPKDIKEQQKDGLRQAFSKLEGL
jgi:hypothetical protein